ncbi:hypothetical protein E1162_08055 [Rhodobacteraceae bacterium RKSG542]|uniref:hypothetical protein n=1 Tax=Pseudovibrio flavus TaxID=2529854 RepID=UPI0012BCA0F6|nr:hypothetical protein [Pseudovibrio flavus]MTI17193.1 hypothetical protein [Pseudovibrio flavus]
MNYEKMSEEQLKTLISNARRLLNKDAENQKASLVLWEAGLQLGRLESTKERRPPINYFTCGLSIGDKLTFSASPDEDIEVYTERTLYWRGQEIHLTPLRETLCAELGIPNDANKYWFVGDVSLTKIYDDTYGPAPSRCDLR